MIGRIKQFIENQGISVRAFEQQIGASNGLIRKAIANNTDIQSKWITAIVDNYPQLNPIWLLTDEGEMIKSTECVPIAKKTTVNESGSIPLIPMSAVAGIFSGEVSVLEYECERFVIPTFKGAEFLISVKGSSMYPKYNSGDIVACKKLPIDTFFQWNKVYVLDTDQGALIKRVKKGSSEDCILIVSDNEKYEPFELKKEHIYGIAIV